MRVLYRALYTRAPLTPPLLYARAEVGICEWWRVWGLSLFYSFSTQHLPFKLLFTTGTPVFSSLHIPSWRRTHFTGRDTLKKEEVPSRKCVVKISNPKPLQDNKAPNKERSRTLNFQIAMYRQQLSSTNKFQFVKHNIQITTFKHHHENHFQTATTTPTTTNNFQFVNYNIQILNINFQFVNHNIQFTISKSQQQTISKSFDNPFQQSQNTLISQSSLPTKPSSPSSGQFIYPFHGLLGRGYFLRLEHQYNLQKLKVAMGVLGSRPSLQIGTSRRRVFQWIPMKAFSI